MNKVHLAVSALLATTVGLFAPASMAENHFYNANFCRVGGSLTWDPQYGIQNIHTTSPGTTICPLVIDGVAPTGTWARVYDRHPDQNVSCTLFITNADGGAVYTSTRTTSGTAAGSKLLGWGDIAGVGTYGALQCTLPPAFNGAFSHVTTYTSNP